MSRRVEVCDMQNAETTLAIIRDHWRAVCGESCKHGSGGGSWKRPARDLARSLPHRREHRCRRTDAHNAAVGSDDKAMPSTAVEANRLLKAVLTPKKLE